MSRPVTICTESDYEKERLAGEYTHDEAYNQCPSCERNVPLSGATRLDWGIHTDVPSLEPAAGPTDASEMHLCKRSTLRESPFILRIGLKQSQK
jgi:hypothetical protein